MPALSVRRQDGHPGVGRRRAARIVHERALFAAGEPLVETGHDRSRSTRAASGFPRRHRSGRQPTLNYGVQMYVDVLQGETLYMPYRPAQLTQQAPAMA